MPVDGYIDTIFASSGDTATVPDAIDPSGYVSYTQGYPSGYEIPPGDPGSLPIERDKMNQIFFDITTVLQQYQQFGTPPFITSTMNGGSPFSYSQHARCVESGVVYTSLENANEDTPPSAKWTTGTAVANGGTGLSSVTAYNLMIGAGTSPLTLLAPAAGTGIPLVSQGASANPAYTTASVVGGGTGRTSSTAYAVICGGTSSTAAQQSVASVGSAGQILTSNGAGALPTFQTPSSGLTLSTIFDTFYPVGTYYWNETVSTNPGTLFGLGTWTQVTDKFIVARGSTYTSTGGAATKSLSSSENGPHTHDQNVPASASGGSQKMPQADPGADNSGSQSAGISTGSSGSGSSFSILPPYQAAYCWKRTA